MKENGVHRGSNGHASDTATALRPGTLDDGTARRVAGLVGEDSPLRPGSPGSMRPSVEFASMLGRLSEAFHNLRGSLQQVDQKIEGLSGTVSKTSTGIETLHDRLDVENGRLAAFDARLSELEERQARALDAIQNRIGDLTRQVGFALGLALTLAVVAVVTLIAFR